MPKLDREQLISIAALTLLLSCACWRWERRSKARSDAVREVTERREMLSRLETR